MEIAIAHEKAEGRSPVDVSRDRVGYDIESGGRHIEVKGVGESWKTYTWQPLYVSEVESLNGDTVNFYLYIVKFEKDGQNSLYIIPGERLKQEFKIKIETYALTPISKSKLGEFPQTMK